MCTLISEVESWEYLVTTILYADWFATIQNSQLRQLQWIFWPGHAEVCSNEREDKLAGSARVWRGASH